MNLIKEFREYIKSRTEIDLGKIAKREATDFFNIELRDNVSCITFKNIIVNINNNHDDIVKILFQLRDKYYNDRINNIIK